MGIDRVLRRLSSDTGPPRLRRDWCRDLLSLRHDVATRQPGQLAFDGKSLAQRLRRGATAEAVALVAAAEIIVLQEGVEVRWISPGSRYHVVRPATRKHSSRSVRVIRSSTGSRILRASSGSRSASSSMEPLRSAKST